jgi:hypothetical protein
VPSSSSSSSSSSSLAINKGQWVGGTASGATSSAIAAVQRKVVSGESVLDNWGSDGLLLCLSLLSGRSTNNSNSNSISSSNSFYVSDNNDNNSNRSDSGINPSENAAVAIHAILLGRGRQAAGQIIMDAFTTLNPSPDTLNPSPDSLGEGENKVRVIVRVRVRLGVRLVIVLWLRLGLGLGLGIEALSIREVRH